MSLNHDAITALAPDQASLKAANGLMKAKKWPLREWAQAEGLVWGECQGSGANPYRTVFDLANHGYKCTCPSRKFPCKHVLALMWMYVDAPGDFSPGSVPEWVTDWLGRRRKTGGAPAAAAGGPAEAKSMAAATLAEPEKAPDPKAEARKKAAAEKRAKETEASLQGAVVELEQWIADQLRTGLSGLMDELTDRCRAIAARMVDGKAQALGSRLDELPARLLPLSGEDRLNALVIELGKLVLLTRAWVASPNDPELRRMVATSETRESLLENPNALRASAAWEVVGEQISTRRDGMVSQATWLMNLDGAPEFAVLLDFFPAATGKRSSSFAPGDQFKADLVFYPAKQPLRAVIAERTNLDAADFRSWPDTIAEDPLSAFLAHQDKAPWLSRSPVLLPSGRLCANGTSLWWQSEDQTHVLPLANQVEDQVRGMDLAASVGLWNGQHLTLMAAQTDWGRVTVGA
ncbi:MAG: SWIM zinc finger family protein [Pseudomonadota bacterium]